MLRKAAVLALASLPVLTGCRILGLSVDEAEIKWPPSALTNSSPQALQQHQLPQPSPCPETASLQPFLGNATALAPQTSLPVFGMNSRLVRSPQSLKTIRPVIQSPASVQHRMLPARLLQPNPPNPTLACQLWPATSCISTSRRLARARAPAPHPAPCLSCIENEIETPWPFAFGAQTLAQEVRTWGVSFVQACKEGTQQDRKGILAHPEGGNHNCEVQVSWPEWTENPMS